MVYETIINSLGNLIFVDTFCSACKIIYKSVNGGKPGETELRAERDRTDNQPLQQQ
jgi:hypothetical protein